MKTKAFWRWCRFSCRQEASHVRTSREWQRKSVKLRAANESNPFSSSFLAFCEIGLSLSLDGIFLISFDSFRNTRLRVFRVLGRSLVKAFPIFTPSNYFLYSWCKRMSHSQLMLRLHFVLLFLLLCILMTLNEYVLVNYYTKWVLENCSNIYIKTVWMKTKRWTKKCHFKFENIHFQTRLRIRLCIRSI